MRQWKIIQTAPNEFEAKYTDSAGIWWNAITESDPYARKNKVKIWSSKQKAEESLAWIIRSYNAEQERKSFVPKEWNYPPNRINGKNVNDL